MPTTPTTCIGACGRSVLPHVHAGDRIRAVNVARPTEFLPWAQIPDDRKRGAGDDREVLGETFLGQPTWLPWMGSPES